MEEHLADCPIHESAVELSSDDYIGHSILKLVVRRILAHVGIPHPVAARLFNSNLTFNNKTAWVTRTLFAVIYILMMGETSIIKKATNIKLHAQNSMERKARKVHF